MTVFLNRKEPPFDRNGVIDDFQDIILKNFDVDEQDMEVNQFLVKFTLDGIDFDLLPATNMAAVHLVSPRDTVRVQSERMFVKIRQAPDPYKAARANSAGLTEAAVEFVKQQSQFAHRVARLAKYWNATIMYTKNLSGRSTIMEFLGIAAAKEEERQNYSRPSILRAFRLFLKKIEDIATQRVILAERFYKDADIPQRVRSQSPLLLDPTNPWNNFMEGFSPEAQGFFKQCAGITLQRLTMVETQYNLNHGYPAFAELFLPQPLMINVQPGVAKSTRWMVGSPQSSRKMQPNLVIRKKSLGDQAIFPIIHKSMAGFVYAANLQAQSSAADMKKLLQNYIDDIFYGYRQTWSPTTEPHENFNVTFEIPVENGQTVIKVSSNWSVN